MKEKIGEEHPVKSFDKSTEDNILERGVLDDFFCHGLMPHSVAKKTVMYWYESELKLKSN